MQIHGVQREVAAVTIERAEQQRARDRALRASRVSSAAVGDHVPAAEREETGDQRAQEVAAVDRRGAARRRRSAPALGRPGRTRARR